MGSFEKSLIVLKVLKASLVSREKKQKFCLCFHSALLTHSCFLFIFDSIFEPMSKISVHILLFLKNFIASFYLKESKTEREKREREREREPRA